MKLQIVDRLNFAALFPEQGDLVSQILVKGIKEKVEVTSEEANEIQLKQIGTQLQWDATKAKEKDIQFNDAELKFLKEQVARLDTEKKVTPDNVGLCVAIQDATVEKK